MTKLLLGFVLGLVTATAALVGAQGFLNQETGTMYQQVPGAVEHEHRTASPDNAVGQQPMRQNQLQHPC